jgi:cell division protein FtsW
MIRSIFRHIIKERDLFSYIALTGLVSQLTIQIIVNIAVSINLAPTKGMTLPFISYGGSSMISTAICLGFILALTKKKYHQDLDYGNIKWL